MTIRPGLKDLFWTAGGAVLLIVLALLALRYHQEENLADKAAFKARRLELVGQMRAALFSASEAEKSAVMAETDEESQSFAERARAASAETGRRRDELGKLLETGGTRDERELLSQFSKAVTEFQRIDDELLDLAVKNTNLKAYGLAYGPAADAVAEMDRALSSILEENANPPDPAAGQVVLLAARAQSGALRIQALLPPHISEESDLRMGEFEARMADEDRKVRSDLKGLAAHLASGSPDLETAMSAYARFTELKSRILELSRQNTNVKSLAISLNQKKKVVQICQDALDALEHAIREEALSARVPASPR